MGIYPPFDATQSVVTKSGSHTMPPETMQSTLGYCEIQLESLTSIHVISNY